MEVGDSARPPRGRLLALLAAVAVAGWAVDQVTKLLAVAHLTAGVPVAVLGPAVHLLLLRNSGAAFSIATGSTWVFTVIALVVVVAVARVARRLGSPAWAVALGLLLAGAVGNLTDRLVRAPGVGRGHVIDFIELPHWPVFNVADSCICAAAVMIALLALRGVELDGTRGRARAGAAPAPDDQPGTRA